MSTSKLPEDGQHAGAGLNAIDYAWARGRQGSQMVRQVVCRMVSASEHGHAVPPLSLSFSWLPHGVQWVPP